MPYSSVKKPAFYTPMFDYFQSIGIVKYKDEPLNDVHLLNPAKTHRMSPINSWWSYGQIEYDIELKSRIPYSSMIDSDGYVYIFILGHNFEQKECSIDIELIQPNTDYGVSPTERVNVLNDNGVASHPSYNGFSIYKAKFAGVEEVKTFRIIIRGFSTQSNVLDRPIKLGCVSLCSKYTPPHSPDLSLTMSREYDGVRTTTTKGGATLSNASYTRGNTFWSSSYAWELTTGDYEQGEEAIIEMMRTLGRRAWNLKFSYINDSDIMPEVETINSFPTNSSDNIYQSKSFLARMLNRVQGSHLPFIFQPNDTDNNVNADQWAIARLDQKKIDIKQVAHKVYDLNLNIIETF